MKKISEIFSHFRFIPLFILAHFSHHVLTALIVPLLPFIRSEFSLNYAQSGLIVSTFTLSYGLSQLPAGWLADRISPRIFITLSVSGVAVAGLLVGLSPSFGMLVASLVFMGLAGGGYHPTAAPLISNLATPKYRGKALGLHVTGGTTSYFLAPLLGVALAAAWGWRGAFWGLSIPVFVVGLILYLRLGPRGPAAGRRNPPTARPSQKASGSLRLAPLILVLILTVVIKVLVASVTSFIPLFMVDHFGADEKTAAAFLAVIFSAGFWAAPLGGHLSDRLGALRLLVMLGLINGPIIYLLPVIPFGIGFVVLLLVIGTVMFMRMPAAEAYLVANIPSHIRSAVLGVYFFLGMEASGLLTPFLGSLIDRYGFRITFMGTGMVILGVALTGTVVLMALKKLGDRGSSKMEERKKAGTF